MRELSLHLLDIIENSIRAGATLIRIRIEKDEGKNKLRIKVEDNGEGMDIEPQEALNPFFTTKEGKRVGLGLSLFAEAVQEAEGELKIERSILGGITVDASMKLTHINRKPLGDLAGTLSPLLLAYPYLDFQLIFQNGDKEIRLDTSRIKAEVGSSYNAGILTSERIFEEVRTIVSLFNI